MEKGELKATVRDIAARSHATPDSRRSFIAEKTIEQWYYAWKQGGIETLTPKPRSDRGSSKMTKALQEAVLRDQKENPGARPADDPATDRSLGAAFAAFSGLRTHHPCLFVKTPVDKKDHCADCLDHFRPGSEVV